MALTATAARERAEEWLQQVQHMQKQVQKTATTFINDTRDEVERRVEDVVGRILGALQIVTTSDVAQLDANLKTIAKRLDQIEQRTKKSKDS